MIDSIYKLFLDELEFFGKNSYFASQSMRNPDECGELIELAIRKFLMEIIGERFKITHGYIYSSQHKKLSPQIDIIITDKLVPHVLKRFDHLDNLEIVPAEAVVAIFEIKRTLRASAFKSAADHLEKIFYDVPLSKDRNETYLPGGIELKSGVGVSIDGGHNSNPLIGIIGLLHEIGLDLNNQKLPWFVDVIFSFQGFLRAPKDNNSDSLKVCTYRNTQTLIEYKAFLDQTDQGRINLLKGFVAYLLRYLSEVSGRNFEVNTYLT